MKEYLILLLIGIYLLSITFYLTGVVRNRNSYRVVAFQSLLLGGIIHSLIFALEVFTKRYFPVLTLYEVFFFYSLLLVILTIILHQFFQFELLEFSTVSVSILLLFALISIGETEPLIENSFLSRLLFIHVMLTLISYVLFAISAIFSFMYLLHRYMLKKKIWNLWIQKLPSLERLARNTYLINKIAIPMLLFGLIIGSIWASGFFQWSFFIDPKVVISFASLLMYSVFLYMAKKETWQKKELAYWNLISFILILINFTLSHSFWSFHRWF